MDPQQPQRPEEPPRQAPPPEGGWSSTPPAEQSNWQQTPQQPGWAPPPQQQQPGWGQTGYYAPPPRPMGATVAGIFYIVIGVLAVLFGILAFAGGSMVGAIPDTEGLGEALGGLITVFAVVGLVIGALFLLSGVGIFLAKTWARVIGLILGVLGAVLYGFGTLGALGTINQEGGAVALLISVVLFALFLVSIWGLATANAYFNYRR